MCMDFIYRHIRGLIPTQIFTTRQLLIYGQRASIDSALSRMVARGFIVRLARGVFVRDISDEPSMDDIVRAKLQSYQSHVATHAESILHELSIFAFGNSNTYAKHGSSSSFDTIRGRAYLKNVSGRKMSLCQTLAGRMVYALWYLGRASQACLNKSVGTATENLNKKERELFWMAGALMPAWLNDSCRYRYPSMKVVRDNPFQMNLTWTEKSPYGTVA